MAAFFPPLLFDVWWFTILESSDSGSKQLYGCFCFTRWSHWDALAKQKSPGEMIPNSRSIILVTMSDQRASAGKDYGSAHFRSMSQAADGLDIKRLQTRQRPLKIKAEKVGWGRCSFRKEKDLKWHHFPKASVTKGQLERRLTVKYNHLELVWFVSYMDS